MNYLKLKDKAKIDNHITEKGSKVKQKGLGKSKTEKLSIPELKASLTEKQKQILKMPQRFHKQYREII